MDVLTILIILSIIVQFLVDRIKLVIPIKKVGIVELAPIYALVIGMLIAFTTAINMLALLGYKSFPIVGYILTGLAISGGSVGIHELIAKIRESRGEGIL